MTQSQALPAWLDNLGDWNPQLLREFKGRLSWRSVLLTVALVTIVQVLLMMNHMNQIPTEASIGWNSNYCINRTEYYAQGLTWKSCGGIDWLRWWRDIFNVQNTWIAFCIYLPAVYFLISDINQEIQRGTINFLRLSPRSSQNILLGKLLGVPCLSYIALIWVIPLHLLCGVMAGISPIFFLSYYSTFMLFGAVLMMGALFIGLSQRNNGNKGTSTIVSGNIFLGLFIAGGVVTPLFWTWNNMVLWLPYFNPMMIDRSELDWFFIPLTRSPIVTHLFTFANLTIVSTVLWKILQRVFQNPTATLISKGQSYFLVPYVVLLLIGFQIVKSQNNNSNSMVSLIEFLLPWLFIGLIFALSTVRQTWFEWIRYRQELKRETQSSSRIQSSGSDLVWGAKSPGLTAIGINLLMVVSIIMTALIFSDSNSSTASEEIVKDWWGLVMSVTLVSIYALLVQWMLMLKTQKRSTWAIGSLFFAIGLPSVIGGLFMSFGTQSPIGATLLLCSPWFRSMLSGTVVPEFSIVMALSIQAIVILFLSWRVWSEYRKMVRS